MEKDPEIIKMIFEENYEVLNEEQVIYFNNQIKNGSLNNVIVGLENHCFGLILKDDKQDENYILFYCGDHSRLEAHLLHTSIHHTDRDSLTFFFADYLAVLFPELDTLDNFNTFQTHLRSCCEMLSYVTIDPYEFRRKYGDENPLFLGRDKKGVVKVPRFEKATFYKDFFGTKEVRELKDGEKYVYLMINKRNNHFKIGRSKSLYHREKTLQSQEPEIELVTFWCCPGFIERVLHRQYSPKRKRGEWFDLTMNDLRGIKAQMQNYN